MKKLLFTILLFNWAVFGQNHLLIDTIFNVNSEKVHYREYLIAEREDEYSYDSTLAKLEIIDSNDSIIQAINLEINAMGSPLYNQISLDYNFDGFNDLSLQFSNGPGFNAQFLNGYFYIYLYDPGTKHFDKYNQELTNPIPVPEEREVYCNYVYSTAYPHELTEKYKWVNGKLSIAETIEDEQLNEQPEEGVILTKEIKKLYKDDIEIKKFESVIKDSIK